MSLLLSCEQVGRLAELILPTEDIFEAERSRTSLLRCLAQQPQEAPLCPRNESAVSN